MAELTKEQKQIGKAFLKTYGEKLESHGLTVDISSMNMILGEAIALGVAAALAEKEKMDAKPFGGKLNHG